MTIKTEISKLNINLMGRLFSYSETMKNTECEPKTNEMNRQDMNSVNEDYNKKQLDFIRKSNKYPQLPDGDYKMLSR